MNKNEKLRVTKVTGKIEIACKMSVFRGLFFFTISSSHFYSHTEILEFFSKISIMEFNFKIKAIYPAV